MLLDKNLGIRGCRLLSAHLQKCLKHCNYNMNVWFSRVFFLFQNFFSFQCLTEQQINSKRITRDCLWCKLFRWKAADWHNGPVGNRIHLRGGWKTPLYLIDLSLSFSMLNHLSGGQACLASLSANVTANYDRLLVPQQVSVGAVRSVWLGPTDELGSNDPCAPRGCCMNVIAPISWAAGIHSADKLALVKHVGSEGSSVFY